MAITYAGVDLLLEDPGHEFRRWLDRVLSLDDMRLFGSEPVGIREGRHDARGTTLARVGLATPNYSVPPRPKLNTLWIPTGAIRWARGLFLADTAGLAKIENNLTSEGSATLILTEERWGKGATKTAKTLKRKMFMLPPRAVNWGRKSESGSKSKSKTKGKEYGWLIPLVDVRYFWQFIEPGHLEVSEGNTWTELISNLASALGTNIRHDDISSDYLSPDPTELTRRHENIAVLLDAIAASIGRRVVLRGTGGVDSVFLLTHSASTTGLNINTGSTSGNTKLAGGDNGGFKPSGMIPARVRVSFPKYVDGIEDPDGDLYGVSKTADNYTDEDTMLSNTYKQFFDTCRANFATDTDESDEGSSSPINSSELDSLTNKIASDYYGWQKYQHDASYSGLAKWNLTGWDDFIWYHFGHQYSDHARDDDGAIFDGDYAAFTRVASMPYNFGVSELLHQVGEATSVSSVSVSSDSLSSLSSASSSSLSSLSTSSEGDDVIVYGPTAFRSEDNICIPKFRLTIVDHKLVATDAGVDCVYICCDESGSYSSSSSLSSQSSESSEGFSSSSQSSTSLSSQSSSSTSLSSQSSQS
tara:strand:- start:4168 stop:5922 length:1755 start_codon:yes stop_codon:yes gene_type:complete